MKFIPNSDCRQIASTLLFHNSQLFHHVYEKVTSFADEIEAVAVDAGYKTPGIMREILSSGKIPAVPYKRPMTKDGFFCKHQAAMTDVQSLAERVCYGGDN